MEVIGHKVIRNGKICKDLLRIPVNFYRNKLLTVFYLQ